MIKQIHKLSETVCFYYSNTFDTEKRSKGFLNLITYLKSQYFTIKVYIKYLFIHTVNATD